MIPSRRTGGGWLPVAVAVFAAAWLATAPQPADAASPRPNIVIILADDMGFSDIGCYGGEVHTPTIDALAAGGLRFRQFYNTARCCPTRACLLTGLYPHQAGIGHMVGDYGVPAYQGYLNERCVTIAEALAAGGYQTLHAGKWHVGENRPHWPIDRGFDQSFGLISGASSFWKLDDGRQMAIGTEPFQPQSDDFYMTDAFTDAAIDFVRARPADAPPFFLYLAYTAPHWPLHAWPEDIARYRGRYRDGWDALRRERHARMIEMGIVEPDWPLTERDERVPPWEELSAEAQDEADLRMAVYAAQIDRMDQGIAKVVATLRERGELENTLILFLADNGGCAEVIDRGREGVPAGAPGSYFSYGIGWANASNTPFRLYKHWVHEGGISTPLVAHWPAGIDEALRGKLTDQPGHLIDLLPTCLDVAGVPYPETYGDNRITPSPGTSLAPLLRGEPLDERTLYWEHEGNRAIRQGKWKLVSKHPGDWELYDLEADRTEQSDLAAEQPERVRRLATEWERWAEDVGVEPWPAVRRRPKPPTGRSGRS